MTSFKDEYEKFYLEISKEISLELLINISKKYEKILNFTSLNSLEELELFFKVQNRQFDIVCFSLNEWSKGRQLSEEELRHLFGFVVQLVSKQESYDNFKKETFIKFANKEEEVDNLKERGEKIIKSFLGIFVQHEKERLQSNQVNNQVQSVSPKSQNQPSSKNNYLWGIIIGMGVVIATLLGVTFFLLTNKKNKKRVK